MTERTVEPHIYIYDRGRSGPSANAPDAFKRPRRVIRRRIKPRFYLFLLLLVVIIGIMPYLRIRAILIHQDMEAKQLQREIDMAKRRIQEKRDKLSYMMTPQYIEEEARKLGMTKKGETRYLLADPYTRKEAEENRRRNPDDLEGNDY